MMRRTVCDHELLVAREPSAAACDCSLRWIGSSRACACAASSVAQHGGHERDAGVSR